MDEKASFNILLADSDEADLDVLHSILKPDYTVYTAKCGEEALQRAREDKPDLILMDVVMPDICGFEILAALKESDLTRHIPVIFVTARDEVADEEKAFALGAVDYITKPFHHSVAKARVKNQIQVVQQIRLIEQLSLMDSLTGLTNRHGFNSQISSEWGRAVRSKLPLSLLMIDADDFKEINDTYGHAQGDVVLRELSKIFKGVLKRPADMAARWGGDEFAVLLPNTPLSGAVEIAEQIRSRVEMMPVPKPAGAVSLQMTVSLGVATVTPEPCSVLSDFLVLADRMLYKAKNAGRNSVSW